MHKKTKKEQRENNLHQRISKISLVEIVIERKCTDKQERNEVIFICIKAQEISVEHIFEPESFDMDVKTYEQKRDGES